LFGKQLLQKLISSGKYEKAPKPTVLPQLTAESKQILN